MVSIIMPVYNAEAYLAQSIDSVLNQDMNDIELILVDDGSSDSSLDICSHYADKDERVHVIHQSNQGVSVARNTGLKNANGDYVAFIDADDEMKKDMISSLYQCATRYNADIVSCSSGYVVNGEIVREEYGTNQINVYNRDEAIEQYLLGGKISIGVWTKLFKKEIISGIYFVEGKKINEDKYFIFEALLRSKVFVLYDVTKYLYFQRDNSATMKPFDARWFDALDFADEILDYVEKNEKQLQKYAVVNKVKSYYWILLKMYKSKKSLKEYKEQYKRIVRYLKRCSLHDIGRYLYRNMKIQIFFLKISEPILRVIKQRSN